MADGLDVVAAGELYVDHILSGFDHWPQPGQESFAESYRREIGGGAAITACGLARLGLRAGIAGVVGRDGADWLRDELSSRGVDVAGIAVDEHEPTGITVAASTRQDRAFLTYAGANRRLPSFLEEGGRLPPARHVHLACAPEPASLRRIVSTLHQQGRTVSVDAGWHPEWLSDPAVLSVLQTVALFLPNEPEAERMTGEAEPGRILEAFHAAGLRRVALKVGARGAALLWDGDTHFARAPAVTPVDTTGAGDCFDAGFLAAWLQGRGPADCLQTANVCGARSTESYGGIAGFPTAAQVQETLAREDLCAK